MINAEKVREVIKEIMHKTYERPDDILREIQKRLKPIKTIQWELSADKYSVLINKKWRLRFALKEYYTISSAFVSENKGE